MNTLLFDAGNTRFKWALVRDGQLGAQLARPLAELDAFTAWLGRAPRIDRVAGVSVAGAAFERRLRGLLRRAGRPAPGFITAGATAAGVRNGYADPAQLGADRWAALVGAWHRAGCYRTVCAASIGTALTIDLVDQDGYHRGGLIAPGPALMLEALKARTADIAPRAARGPSRRRRSADARPIVPPLAGSTRQAIEEGCLAAAAGLVDRTINQLTRTLNVRPVLFVTGGAADAMVPRLRSACRPVDDLVLRGVAVLAEVPIRRRPARP